MFKSLFFTLCFPFLLFSQQNNDSLKTFKFYNVSFFGISYIANPDFNNLNKYRGAPHIVNGIMYKEVIGLGIGIGFEGRFAPDLYAPIYLESRWKLSSSQNSPFIAFAYGRLFNFGETGYDFGWIGVPELGYVFKISKTAKLGLSMVYKNIKFVRVERERIRGGQLTILPEEIDYQDFFSLRLGFWF